MIKSLFSAKSIEELSPIVLEVIEKALGKAKEYQVSGGILDMQRLYTGITVSRPPGNMRA
jgi:hypothetical protein